MQSQLWREQILSFIFGINRKMQTTGIWENSKSPEKETQATVLQDTVLSDVQKILMEATVCLSHLRIIF